MNNRPAPSLLKLEGQAQLQDYITAIACHPLAAQWAIASAAGEVAIWQQQHLQHCHAAAPVGIDCLGYSANGKFLAAGGRNGYLAIWADGIPQPVPTIARGWIDRLAWHPQQPWLAFSSGRALHRWDATTQQLTSLPMAHAIFDMAWHPQGTALATAGYRGVAVRSIDDWETAELLGVDTGAHRLAWSPTGQYLAAATLDRLLTIARTDALEQPWVMSGFPGKIQDLAWCSGEPLLATMSADQLVYWFGAEEQWQALPEAAGVFSLATAEQSLPGSIAAHPHVPLVARTAASGEILLQDVEFATLDALTMPACTAIVWHPSGQVLAAGSASGSVVWWKSIG